MTQQRMRPCSPHTLCSVQITSTPCTRICVPSARNIASIKFADNGTALVVTLSAQAALPGPLVPCSPLFTSATNTLLGAAQCSVSGSTLTIYLGGDATVKAGDTLELLSSQTALVDFFTPTNAFTGA